MIIWIIEMESSQEPLNKGEALKQQQTPISEKSKNEQKKSDPSDDDQIEISEIKDALHSSSLEAES